MARRVLTAVILLSIMVAGFLLPVMQWLMVLLLGAAAVQCVWELAIMLRKTGVRVDHPVAALTAAALVIEGTVGQLSHAALILGVGMVVSMARRLTGPVQGAIRDMTATLGILAYIGLPLGAWASLYVLGNDPGAVHHRWMLLALAVIFLTDSGALFIGKAIGRNKLCPRISPGKTIEGSIGGILFAFLGAGVARMAFAETWSDVSDFELVGFVLLFSILTQIGDLVESLIKRDAEVKDSGGSLTGHGGFLDMLDAVLFCGVPLYLYLRMFHAPLLVAV